MSAAQPAAFPFAMPAISPISAIPAFVSPAEHQNIVSSTPDDFSNIPPVLRHREDDVSVTLEPSVEGISVEDTTKGTLYVIESALVFFSTTGRGFEIKYPSITLHAISRTTTGPSIYCQLDEGPAAPALNGHLHSTEPTDADAEGTGEDDIAEMRELTIVPQNAASLEAIFEALSLCASLHPDPSDEMDDDDDAFIDADPSSLEIFTGDEDQELSEAGRAALEHLESIIYNPWEERRRQQEQEEQRTSSHDGGDATGEDRLTAER